MERKKQIISTTEEEIKDRREQIVTPVLRQFYYSKYVLWLRCWEVVRSDDKKSIYKRRSMKNNEDTNSCSKDETFFVTGYEGKWIQRSLRSSFQLFI